MDGSPHNPTSERRTVQHVHLFRCLIHCDKVIPEILPEANWSTLLQSHCGHVLHGEKRRRTERFKYFEATRRLFG